MHRVIVGKVKNIQIYSSVVKLFNFHSVNEIKSLYFPTEYVSPAPSPFPSTLRAAVAIGGVATTTTEEGRQETTAGGRQ